MPGGILSISANANTYGSGILWASHPYNQDANHAVVTGILRAYHASDLTRELWNSEQDSSRDHLGNFAKFCPPTIANGKVYMATFSGCLAVYGLLPKKDTKDSKEKEKETKERDKLALKEKDTDLSTLAMPSMMDHPAQETQETGDQAASGTAFISPDERPLVGEHALKQADEV
jgi:hypothetical protein